MSNEEILQHPLYPYIYKAYIYDAYTYIHTQIYIYLLQSACKSIDFITCDIRITHKLHNAVLAV